MAARNTDRDPSEQLIAALSRIASDAGLDAQARARRLLELGCARFGLEIGVLARVDDGQYRVVALVPSAGSGLREGTTLELGSTFCALVIESGWALGIEHAAESEHASHPAREDLGLEAYLGAPVFSGRGCFGTLSFASRSPRTQAFSEADFDTLRLLAAFLGGDLWCEQLERALGTATDALRELTRIDPLTQLLNRDGLEDKLVRLLRRNQRDRAPMSGLLIEIDELSSLTADHGPAVRDALLRGTADALSRALRPADLLGRVADAQFAALLPGASPEAAQSVARRIQAAVHKQVVSVAAGEISPTVSIGFAPLVPATHTISALSARTNERPWLGKRGGADSSETDV